MTQRKITVKDIEKIAPFSRGSTEIFSHGALEPEKASLCGEDVAVPRDVPYRKRYRAGLCPYVRGRV